MKQFKVDIFFSSFCTYEIEAEDESEAIEKARNMKINESEILSNLEAWNEADSVAVIE
jgi:hypothetical protein